MSAALTAVALLLGAGMASGAGMLASKMSTEPEPDASSYARDLVDMPAPADQSPAPAPAPASESSTPPSEPAEEPTGDEMAGGAVGRPPWGAISKTVIQPSLPGSVTSTVTTALGLPTSQKELETQLISVNEQLRVADFERFQLGDKIKKGGETYEKLMSAFATMNEQVKESSKNNTLIAYWTQKLKPQSENLSNERRNQLKSEKDKTDTTPERKREIEDIFKNSGKQKEIDPEDAAKWSGKLADAMSEKSMADFKKDESNRDVVKYKARVDDIRKQTEEKEKLIKELVTKRDAILIQIQNLVIQSKKTPLARDWPERIKRYADAVQRLKTAEVNFSAFISEVWRPLKEKGAEGTEQPRYNSLKKIYDDARSEMVVARSRLTENTVDSNTTGRDRFDAFVGSINESIQNAVESNNTLRPEFTYNVIPATAVTPNLGRGYSPEVQKLKDFASKDRLKAVADVYYDISKQDSDSLKQKAKEYTEFFDKIKGSLKRASDRVLRKGTIGFEITQDVLKDFVQRQLSAAYNAVRYLPQTVVPTPTPMPPTGAATQNSVDVYMKVRKETTEFVDEQVFTINRMIKVISDAKRKTPNDDKIKLLYDQVKSLFVLPRPGFPAEGMCQRTFKPSTFEYLRTGKYGNDKIATLLTSKEESATTQRFLDEIGYTNITNFSDAKRLVTTLRTPDITPADPLLRQTALDGYIKYIERQAFGNPAGDSGTTEPVDATDVNSAAGVITAILRNAITTTGQFKRIATLNTVNPGGAIFNAGAPVTYSKLASDLRRLRDADPNLRFTPKIYLEGQNTFLPISEFKNACEIDGNVGHGPEESKQILDLLNLISKIDIEPETSKSELLMLIEKLEKDGKVDITRADQSRVDNTLATKGFIDLPNWTIMKVSDDTEDNDFVMTFLMLRSGKFKSIPYDEKVAYNGKTSNARKVYARLAKAEILKLPEFKQKTGDFKEEDWGKISDAFNVGIVIFKKDGRRPVANTTYDDKPGALTFYVYKDADGKYSPVRLQLFGRPIVGVPAMAPGVAGPAVGRAEGSIYSAFGGAIEGPVLSNIDKETQGTILEGVQHYSGYSTVAPPLYANVGAPLGRAAAAAPGVIADRASAAYGVVAPLGRAAVAAPGAIARGARSAYGVVAPLGRAAVAAPGAIARGVRTVLVPVATAAARGLVGAAAGTGFVVVSVSTTVLAGMGLVAVGARRLHGAAVEIWDNIDEWRRRPPAAAPPADEVAAAVDAVEAPLPGEENNPFGLPPDAAEADAAAPVVPPVVPPDAARAAAPPAAAAAAPPDAAPPDAALPPAAARQYLAEYRAIPDERKGAALEDAIAATDAAIRDIPDKTDWLAGERRKLEVMPSYRTHSDPVKRKLRYAHERDLLDEIRRFKRKADAEADKAFNAPGGGRRKTWRRSMPTRYTRRKI